MFDASFEQKLREFIFENFKGSASDLGRRDYVAFGRRYEGGRILQEAVALGKDTITLEELKEIINIEGR